MKISLAWLNDYVDARDFVAKPQDLANALTAAGLEVEGFTDAAKQFQHVVVGHIIELGKHPNADKLTLCQVDVGDGKHRQIVCGAKNHRQGDKVVVALPGAVLPGDFAIKLSKIRDVESQGMLCSETELGLAKEAEGILLLKADAKVGTPFAKHYGLEDVIFEINVTPNRADCLSHIGLAREVSTLFNRPLKMPKVTAKGGKKKVRDHIKVELKDSESCTRYCGRGIYGVKVGPSPDWLKRRLESVGVNSINNVVDVTNFVMLEYGQPLHAFDANTLKGREIRIEKAKAKETFKSFDGTEVTLAGDELTIRDGEKAVALAGIVGGLNSGVSGSTVDIFLEAAHFNPRAVRRTARKFGIDTDSSYRFSRGTDPEAVVDAMNRAAFMIQEVAGGEVSTDHYDQYPKPVRRPTIDITTEYLEERLGYPVKTEDFVGWMKRLHCDLQAKGKAARVTPPAFRVDLEIPEDLVEEYARLNGYDKIPEAFPPIDRRPTDDAATYVAENRVGDLLAGEGFYEVRNFGFLADKWQKSLVEVDKFMRLGLDTGGEVIPVMNPLSEETGVMRQSLVPGLLTNLIHNVHHGLLEGRVFEQGFVFGRRDGKYSEGHRVALMAWGQSQGLWEKSTRPVVYDLKAALESAVGRMQGKLQLKLQEDSALPKFLHPGQAAAVFYEGKIIGYIGALHPSLRDELKIRVDAAVAEIDLSALVRGQPRSPKAKPISKFPAVERDLALVKPNPISAAEIVREIEKAAGPVLQSVRVFDVYRGANLPQDHESVAFRMVFQDLEGTLTDERLTAVTNQILEALTKKYPVKVR